jgi:hypothetical protein
VQVFSIKIKSDGSIDEYNFENESMLWIITPDFQLTPVDIHEVSVDHFIQRKIYHKRVVISASEGLLNFIATPFCCSEDIYFTGLEDGSLFLSNDFYECCKRAKRLSVSEENLLIYYSTNTAPAGKTFFNEVQRILPDGVWQWTSKKFVDLRSHSSTHLEPFLSSENEYSVFKKVFDKTIEHEIGSLSELGLMYSGGVDSTLIGQVITKKFGRRITCCTIETVPTNSDFERDNARIELALNQLNWPLHRSVVDFNSVNIADLKEFAISQPMAPHISFGFFEMAKHFGSLGTKKVFCGQNLDTLYALGATNKIGFSQGAMAALFRRFYFSKSFLSTLGDVGDPKNIGTFVSRLVGRFGVGFYSYHKKTHYQLPSTGQELLKNYQISPDEVVFSVAGGVPETIAKSARSLRSHDVYQSLLRHKITEYLMGGINMTPHNTFRKYDSEACLPYGSNLMTYFYLRNQLKIKDIFKPKKFVYNYSKELGPDLFSRNHKLARASKKAPDAQMWYAELLNNTSFGRSLKETQPHMSVEDKTSTEAQKFNRHLCNFWQTTIFSNVNKYAEIIR